MHSKGRSQRAKARGGVAAPVPSLASQPHGTTQDQVNEMESEGQATKAGQIPTPPPRGPQAAQMPDRRPARAGGH